MDGSETCLKIEKTIKDMLFKPGACENPLENKADLSQSHIPPDSRCFVSHIENPSRQMTRDKIPPFRPSGTSELIDLNVLTNFAAQHIEDPHFSASDLALSCQKVKPPHPDLEDGISSSKNGEQNPNIAVWFSSISEEIESSPNFLKMPENLLSQTVGSPPQGSAASPQSRHSDKKDSKKKKKRKKEKKVRNSNSTRELPSDPIVSEEIKDTKMKSPVSKLKDSKSSEKQGSVESPTVIKLKKDVFASIGTEYYFYKNEGHYKFQCHICNWNNDSIDMIVHHIGTKNHCTQKTQNDMDMMLSFLPEPLKPQVESVTDLLLSIAWTYGLQDSNITARIKLYHRLKEYVETHLPGCSVDLVGSTAFNCGLKSSEVDFVLNVGPNLEIPDTLEGLYELMVKDKAFDKVVNDFKKKRPQIIFVDHETNLPCYILIDNGSSLKIANLLSVYFRLDERARTLGIALRYWAKMCLIDKQDNGTFPSFSFALLLVHFLQQVQPPVLPVIHEEENYASTPEFYAEYISKNNWKSQNSASVGQLWIKLFQYYNFDYKIGETVVCVRSSKRVTCKDKNWNTKFYAVEDPFVKRNVAYVIPTYQVCQFIHQCFVRTYRYFAYPQLKEGSVNLLKTEDFDALQLSEYVPNTVTLKEGSDESDESDNEDSVGLNAVLEDHDPCISLNELVATVSNLEVRESEGDKRRDSHPKSEEMGEKAKELSRNTSKTAICRWDLEGNQYVKEDFKYEFTPVTFKGNKTIPLTCKLCKEQGHQKKDCPIDDLPPVNPLPKMNPEFMNTVSNVLNSIRDRNMVIKKDINAIERHMKDVENCIKNVYPDATLQLFGSYCNGFGFKSNSDMDFCLTFEGHQDGKNLNSTDIIKKVGKQLLCHPQLENIVPITSAKVPIVKFSWKHTGIEADISLYNTLALVNTELLEAYSKIDRRVPVLGYTLKYFAKHLGICDASRGSLSSYAYILMVIFFLQQRNPPVIPVLQELYSEAEKPSLKVEECNVWFYRDVNKLKEIWPDYGKNKENVGELWLGLLNFYTCEFDWKEYVVSIKQKKLLTRFKKLWQTTQLAIEDPFDLNHNLGAGLSKKMNSYILKAFIRARERFGSPVFLEKPEPYLFNRSFLNSGIEPPQDRGCSNCGKIGHLARNCPQEKTCSFCRKPGHLMKNCPQKRGDKKPKDRQRSRGGQTLEPKEKRYNQNYKNDFKQQRPYLPNQPPPDTAKLMASGIPTHRFPTFQGVQRPMMPPPGFMGGPRVPPFGGLDTSVPPPFPLSKNEMNPPKPYGSSPPKNFSPKKTAFHPDSWGFPADRRNPERMRAWPPERFSASHRADHSERWQPTKHTGSF